MRTAGGAAVAGTIDNDGDSSPSLEASGRRSPERTPLIRSPFHAHPRGGEESQDRQTLAATCGGWPQALINWANLPRRLRRAGGDEHGGEQTDMPAH